MSEDEAACIRARNAARICTLAILGEVSAERQRQREKFGAQDDRPSFCPTQLTGPLQRKLASLRSANETAPSWDTIIREEVLEARLAPTAAELRAELVQVAAVAVAWIEALDRGAK